VVLLVSRGPGVTTIPDVTGLPQKEAVKQIEKAGLFATLHEEHNAKVSSGRVIRTDPTALNQVQKGSRVDVYVSTGPELTTVPDVVGDDRADARATIEDSGLKVTIHEQESSQPKDKVISQSPGAGSTVARGSRVTITVSKGVQKVRVPDVQGQSQQDATKALTDAGFTVTVDQKETDNQDEVGNVISQDPGAGTELQKGDTVAIVVGKAPKGGAIGGDSGGAQAPGQ
jgi:serine/threonine-protein kinase